MSLIWKLQNVRRNIIRLTFAYKRIKTAQSLRLITNLIVHWHLKVENHDLCTLGIFSECETSFVIAI